MAGHSISTSPTLKPAGSFSKHETRCFSLIGPTSVWPKVDQGSGWRCHLRSAAVRLGELPAMGSWRHNFGDLGEDRLEDQALRDRAPKTPASHRSDFHNQDSSDSESSVSTIINSVVASSYRLQINCWTSRFWDGWFRFINFLET